MYLFERAVGHRTRPSQSKAEFRRAARGHRAANRFARAVISTVFLALALLGMERAAWASSSARTARQDEPNPGIRIDAGLEYRRSLRVGESQSTIVDEISTSQAGGVKRSGPRKLIVDTDMGVDDAAGIGWLLTQRVYPVEILGITTVAGNGTVDNVANNVLTLLKAAGLFDPDTGDLGIPVVIGARAPLERPLSNTAKFIHGPDGLWYNGQFPPFDQTELALGGDPAAFYCDANLKFDRPRTTLIALGPLTNLARTSPDCLAEFERIVILGGAINGGNKTLTTEFNFWTDPESAAIVLNAAKTYPLNIELVLYDAFETFRIKLKDVRSFLPASATADPTVSELVGSSLVRFICVQTQDPDCEFTLPLHVQTFVPDVVAVMYAMDEALGSSAPAMVEVVAGSAVPEVVRGQTIVGFDLNDWATMTYPDATLSATADLVFDNSPPLAPDYSFLQALFYPLIVNPPINAKVITSITLPQMQRIFLKGLASENLHSAQLELPDSHGSNNVYLPVFQTR